VHRGYAIECLCSHRRERFQLTFARTVIELLPQAEETAFEPSRKGLTVLAETEMELERPLARLRAVYGEDVRIEPPVVRFQRGEQLEEPHMGLRVLCSPQHFDHVRRDLLLRHAALLDAELNEQFGVVRACAPLTLLVGYPARIRQLTAGRGQLAMWLSHYAPVVQKGGPPNGDSLA